jgi:hypothetical protein
MARKKSVHYVDNKKFLEEIMEYKRMCAEYVEREELIPPLPDYIGECFMKIAERLSYRPNFVNYAFREEMIADGIENCVQYSHNFNPEKSNNPFSYFTQIIYFAFVRRIQKEKKQLYIKYKTIQNSSLLSDNVELSQQDKGSFNVETLTEEQKINMYEFMNNFEIAKKKKIKKVANTLVTFAVEAT